MLGFQIKIKAFIGERENFIFFANFNTLESCNFKNPNLFKSRNICLFFAQEGKVCSLSDTQ